MPHVRRSVVEPVLEAAVAADLPAVVRLLTANALPVADVERHLDGFVVARSAEDIVGTVGLESYGNVALLRSLCVAQAHRGQGIAATLLSTIEAVALTHGVREVYLLTTDARPYFERHGFAIIPRDAAPEAIRLTTEFQSLCPSSASAMRKTPPATVRYLPRGVLPLRQEIPGARVWSVSLDSVMLTYFEVDAGVRFAMHHHDGEQITTVVDGQLYVETAQGVVRVGAGDSIAIPPRVSHAVFTRTEPARAFDCWSSPFPQFAAEGRSRL